MVKLSDSATRRRPAESKARDLELRDAKRIFESAWQGLEQEIVGKRLRFPSEIIWLNGAPGAGKGTQTPFILEMLDLTSEPIRVSELLLSPEAVRLKNAGLMVDDGEVTDLVLHELLVPIYQGGAIVDGYPRTMVQVECLKLLYNRILQSNRESIATPTSKSSQTTTFHIVVLLVDEVESIRRQLHRGRQSGDHNERVRRTGRGGTEEVRKTDMNESVAQDRYRTFTEITYEPLKSLRGIFPYHQIDAGGTVEEVRGRVVEELHDRNATPRSNVRSRR